MDLPLALLVLRARLEEQKRSGFRYHFSNYQMEDSRNLIFAVGGRMEQVFQSLIDGSRAPLDLKTRKTLSSATKAGRKTAHETRGRPNGKSRSRDSVYDLTVFKLHCGKLALKIYSKGERVLRIEAVAHNIREFRCGRSLDNFPEIVRRLKGMLERFMQALSCIDQCFIGDEMLERLPLPSRVGKSVVGGIDLNKPRLRHVAQAVIALSASTDGFTASTLADQVRAFRQSGSIRLRSSPSRLRSEETPRQTNRPADRRDASLRAHFVRSAGDHCPTRAPRESHQTAARGRSGHQSHPRSAKPSGHRSPLP